MSDLIQLEVELSNCKDDLNDLQADLDSINDQLSHREGDKDWRSKCTYVQRKKKAQVRSLKAKITELNKLIANTRANKARQLKEERISNANTETRLIHNAFKKLVREFIGEERFMVLIKKAEYIAIIEANKDK